MVLGEDHPKSGQVQWTRKRRAVGALGQRIGHHRRTTPGLAPSLSYAKILWRNSGYHTCSRCRVAKPRVSVSACHGRQALDFPVHCWPYRHSGGAPGGSVPSLSYVRSFCRTSGRHACLRCRAVSCCVSVSSLCRLYVLGVPRHYRSHSDLGGAPGCALF